MSAAAPLADLVAARRILVCLGLGGVGKTTIAASLALAAARQGRRALVMTIDPARRLADALGVGALGNTPQAIPRATLQRVGVPRQGALCAMMLDMKRTFDDLVERFAEDETTRDRILRNPIYQHISDALAGSGEYCAMEKIFELSQVADHDLIVVDTPPSRQAVDFLEAPERLLEFLDSRLVQMLVHPAFAAGRLGFRIFHRGTQRALRVIERLSGIGFLEDISDFLLAFEGMSEGFRDRAHRVRTLLLGPECAFVLVAGPASSSVEDSIRFLDHLETTGVPVAAVVANRVRAWPEGGPPLEDLPRGHNADGAVHALAEAFARSEGEGFPAEVAARAAIDTLSRYASAVRCDRRSTERLFERARGGGRSTYRVPEMERDVHDLDGLGRIAEQLAQPAEAEEAVGG